MTVRHLADLRAQLNAIDFQTAFARTEAIDQRAAQPERPEDLH